MIKDFILGIRLLKYCYGIKTNVACAMLFLAAGALLLFRMPDNGIWTIYLVGSGAFLAQILSSLNATAMANSSPRRKALNTLIPMILSLPLYLLLYGASCLVELWMLYKGKVWEQELAQSVIMAGLVMMWFMVYIGGAFKYFVASLMMAVVAILFIIFGGNIIFAILEPHISIGAALLIGLAEVLLGVVLQYLLSLLLYRQSASKAAQMRQLQKYM